MTGEHDPFAWKKARGVLKNVHPDVLPEDLIWCARSGISVEDFREVRERVNGPVTGMVSEWMLECDAAGKRIAELGARTGRLVVYIKTVEAALPIVNWKKHKAALLEPGDLDPTGGDDA